MSRAYAANGLTKALSKAGRVAQVMVQYAVKLVVQAWCDDQVNPDETISQVYLSTPITLVLGVLPRPD